MTDASSTVIPPTVPLPLSEPLTEEGGRALVADWQQSGQSCATYCAQRGLRTQRLLYWRQRLGVAPRKPAPPASATGVSLAAGFVELVPESPRSDGMIEVVCSGGVVVRLPMGSRPEAIRQVVDALRMR
jgi:hypothetical protein